MNKKNGGNAARQVLDFTRRKMPLDKLFRELKLSDNAINIKIGTEVSNKDGKKAKLSIQIALTVAALLLLLYLLFL